MTEFRNENWDFEVDLTDAYKELAQSFAMENEDKITDDYIQYCLKYDIKKTIEFDKKRKKMIANFPDHSEEMPLVELLLSFLLCDFSTYETARKLTRDIYDNPNSNFKSAGFPTNLPPFFVSDYDEILKDLSAMEPYYIYCNNSLDLPKFQFACTFNITPNKVPDSDMHIFRTQKNMTAEEVLATTDINDIVTPNELLQEMIDYTKNQKIKMTEAFEVYDVESITYLEFYKMLEYNLMTRKCHNCSRYFIFKGNYGNKYRDRKYIGSRTCQQIGADKDYTERVKNRSV